MLAKIGRARGNGYSERFGKTGATAPNFAGTTKVLQVMRMEHIVNIHPSASV
jgi:hypothetical protein